MHILGHPSIHPSISLLFLLSSYYVLASKISLNIIIIRAKVHNGQWLNQSLKQMCVCVCARVLLQTEPKIIIIDDFFSFDDDEVVE